MCEDIARVSTDLENLKNSRNLNSTSESQGICPESQRACLKIQKVREKSDNFASETHF